MHGESVRKSGSEGALEVSGRRALARSLARVLAVLACGAALAGWLAPVHNVFGLARHFPTQIAALALVALTLAMLARTWHWAGLGAFALGKSVLVLVLALGPEPKRVKPGASVLRLVSANVHTSHPDPRQGARRLRALSPDLVLALEVDQGWLDALDRELHPLRRIVGAARDDNFGIALYAAPGLAVEGQLLELPGGVLALDAWVEAPSGPLRLYGVHTLPPAGSHFEQLNREQLEHAAGLAARADERGERVVLAGDLNMSPWTAEFSALLQGGRLIDAGRRQRGLRGTFPAPPWAAVLRIPIDHVLVSDEVEVGVYRVGGDFGSDHRPLVVDLR